MDRLVSVLSTDDNQDVKEDLEKILKEREEDHLITIADLRSHLEQTRAQNRDLAVRLTEEQKLSAKLHATLCESQAELFANKSRHAAVVRSCSEGTTTRTTASSSKVMGAIGSSETSKKIPIVDEVAQQAGGGPAQSRESDSFRKSKLAGTIEEEGTIEPAGAALTTAHENADGPMSDISSIRSPKSNSSTRPSERSSARGEPPSSDLAPHEDPPERVEGERGRGKEQQAAQLQAGGHQPAVQQAGGKNSASSRASMHQSSIDQIDLSDPRPHGPDHLGHVSGDLTTSALGREMGGGGVRGGESRGRQIQENQKPNKVVPGSGSSSSSKALCLSQGAGGAAVVVPSLKQTVNANAHAPSKLPFHGGLEQLVPTGTVAGDATTVGEQFRAGAGPAPFPTQNSPVVDKHSGGQPKSLEHAVPAPAVPAPAVPAPRAVVEEGKTNLHPRRAPPSQRPLGGGTLGTTTNPLPLQALQQRPPSNPTQQRTPAVSSTGVDSHTSQPEDKRDGSRSRDQPTHTQFRVPAQQSAVFPTGLGQTGRVVPGQQLLGQFSMLSPNLGLANVARQISAPEHQSSAPRVSTPKAAEVTMMNRPFTQPLVNPAMPLQQGTVAGHNLSGQNLSASTGHVPTGGLPASSPATPSSASDAETLGPKKTKVLQMEKILRQVCM